MPTLLPVFQKALPHLIPGLCGVGCLLFVSACGGADPVNMVSNIPAPTTNPEGTIRVTGDAELVESAPGDERIAVRLKQARGRSTVVFEFAEERLDVSAFRNMTVDIANRSNAELDVLVSALSDLQDTWSNRAQGRFLIRPGEEDAVLPVFMTRPRLPAEHPLVRKLGNLYGFPGGHHRHWEHVKADGIMRVTVRMDWSNATAGQSVSLSAPYGSGDYRIDEGVLAELELPLVDEFGQMRSGSWAGKISSVEELRADAATDLAAAAFAEFGEGRSGFGGFSAGPRFEATGFFRVEQVGGRWWFVDPEGYLFWSVGSNSVARGSVTRVTGRKSLFPAGASGELAQYTDNLERKYGSEDWAEKHVDVTLGRMLEWGMNTVGAWSMPELGAAQRVPYTLIVHTHKEGIGPIRKMPDPYSPRFSQSLEDSLSRIAEEHANSPWLLGVFVHNELDWKGGIEISEQVLKSAPRVPARQAAIAYLRSRYPTVEALNAAWGADFADFDAVRPLASANEAYRSDLTEIMDQFASKYFEVCRDAMRRFFPNHLYMGCRFHNFHPIVTRAASRYCDVLSANIYHFGVSNFSMATDVNRPIIIGEFHFGIGDFGHWGRGLRAAADARNQADLLRAYLSDALRHPDMVGAHWFAWSDQPVTGRFDGENFGIGLVSIVDRPHALLIESLRNTASALYRTRLER